MKQPQPSNDMNRIVDLNDAPPSPPTGADPYDPAGDRRGVTAVLDSMVRNTEARERSFEQALQDQLARRPQPAEPAMAAPAATLTVPASPAPAQPAPDLAAPDLAGPAETMAAETVADAVAGAVTPAAEEPADPVGKAAGSAAELSARSESAQLPAPRVDIKMDDFAALGRPQWSLAKLEQIDMPPELLERIAELDPAADIKWVEALVRAATPTCSPVVDASSLFISRDHTALAEALGLDVHRPGDLPPYGGSIFCLVENLDTSREWLDRIIGDRVIHAVLTDAESESLLGLAPAAVSYASEMGAARALRTALVDEIPLTFGITHDGTPIRATPFDVALAIRSWMRKA